jgi:hypothetical protein
VTFKNIGAPYDNASGNGWIGPNVLLRTNGRDGMFTERNVDWTIGSSVQFEVNVRDGFHCEDCASYRFSLDDWGANGRYGFYAAVVNSQCSSPIGTEGNFILASQFGANGYLPGTWSGAGGDIYVNGSAASAAGFCASPGTSQWAGSMTIVGNQFIESAATANLTNSIQFIDAGGNNVTGNNWGENLYDPQYNYLVTSTFSSLTGSARVPNQISKNSLEPTAGGPIYQAVTPYSITSGVDKADAVTLQGTETEWGDRDIYGLLYIYNPTGSAIYATGSTTLISTAGNAAAAIVPGDDLSTTKEIYGTTHAGSYLWWINDNGSASFPSYANSNGILLPFTLTGYHGTGAGDVKVQLSDGTGTSVPAAFDATGGLTAAPAGIATLSSGTVTVSNSTACTPSSTCVYNLTNCGLNSSTAIGTLSIGTVAPGSSFVINSESSTAIVVTGDKSIVCWQIN